MLKRFICDHEHKQIPAAQYVQTAWVGKDIEISRHLSINLQARQWSSCSQLFSGGKQ